MKKSESIVEISKAMAEFHQGVKQPLKDTENLFFKKKYVPLENVVQSINDIAPKHGLSFTQWAVNNENGTIGVSTLLMHSSGEFIEYPAIYAKPDKPTAQGLGSVITYLKRYALSAIFGITSDQDDDGNEATKSTQQPKQKYNKQETEKPKPTKQVGKAVILAKFKQGGGTDEQFNTWYKKQSSNGVEHNKMDEYLTKTLLEKKEKQ